MKLTVFNGSPKGKESNTKFLVDLFLAGFESLDGNSSELFYLNRVGEVEQFRQAFSEAEAVLLAFPLYTDAMPGLVKAFIEALEPLCGREGNPLIGFMVQSGFPEAVHSRYVEQYLEKLADRLGCAYAGTIIKGNGGSVRTMPPLMTRQLFKTFHQVGKSFGRTRQFDRRMLAKLAGPEPYPRWLSTLTKLKDLPFINLFWIIQLLQNGAYTYKRRSARPYTE
jgi:NAD(P)H-dependent FMN reductase